MYSDFKVLEGVDGVKKVEKGKGIFGDFIGLIVEAEFKSFAGYLLARCTKPTSLARSRKVFGDKKL
ncbi:hypothetical protein [Bacillus paramycoides]|uniref:hypothetical protein n=1 Tax=Bacillus paramycoides TaxID=2026194 RepID=UPI002244E604|nr:hypothetical protein [Bacillus paramycoides]